MSAAVNAVSKAGSAALDTLSSAVGTIGNAVTKVVDNVMGGVDRLMESGALMQIALVAMGVPPVLSAAAVTAAKGGNMRDVVRSSLLAYGAGQLAKGAGFGDLTTSIGNSVAETTGQQLIGSMTTSGLNAAVLSAAVAKVTGGDVSDAFGKGFLGGAVGSMAEGIVTSEPMQSYFKDIGADWGLSGESQKYIQGATRELIEATAMGATPGEALTNYTMRTMAQLAQTKVAEGVKGAYQAVSKLGDPEAKQKELAARMDEASLQYGEAAVKYDEIAQSDAYKDYYSRYNALESQAATLLDLEHQYNVAVQAGDTTTANAVAAQYNSIAKTFVAERDALQPIATQLTEQIQPWKQQMDAAKAQYETAVGDYTAYEQEYTRAVEEARKVQEEYAKAAAPVLARNEAVSDIYGEKTKVAGYDPDTKLYTLADGTKVDAAGNVKTTGGAQFKLTDADRRFEEDWAAVQRGELTEDEAFARMDRDIQLAQQNAVSGTPRIINLLANQFGKDAAKELVSQLMPKPTAPTAPGGARLPTGTVPAGVTSPLAALTGVGGLGQAALLMGLAGAAQPRAPAVQPQTADIEYVYDVGGTSIFAPMGEDPTKPTVYAAAGGSVEELLKLLR